jgi:Cu(I)/Ag(I) efflux system membrane fusion protein
VSKRTIAAQVDAVATVQWNDRDVSIVQARTSGFVQKVYGRAVGDVVAAGAPIADVLNPDWSGAQGEYLAVRATKDEALIAAARKRLLLLGMSEALIATVERTNTVMGVQTLLAPRAGMIAELGVRDGMTLSAGAMVARINGLATVWLEAAVPEAQLAAIKIGQMADARFAALPGEVLHGKVNAVLPEQDREARTTRVRIELPNPGLRLKPGLVAQVRLQGPSSEALVLPSEAVIRTGRRALVMLQDAPGKFRPVEVQLGTEQGDELVISGGLNEGQQVAASGQFLLDSEASLRGIESGTTAGSKP